MNESFAFSEVVRKLANLIRLGKVVEIDGANVKVKIGKVITPWLPIISTAGETVIWIPISIGEQVAVFSPYGESAQGFVLRSINYDDFPAASGQNAISVNTKHDVTVAGECKCDVLFNHGFEIRVGNASLKISDSAIQLSCGSSNIDISENSITINSERISTNPPLCKCLGGL